MLAPVDRQHFLDQPLVVRVRERFVAADRIVFGQPLRVVGVIAVGRAARGDDDLPYAGGHAGVEHVARAEHVHGVLELAVRLRARRHDGRQVHDRVDCARGQQRARARRSRTSCSTYSTPGSRDAAGTSRTSLATTQSISPACSRGASVFEQLAAEVAGTAGDEDSPSAHAATSAGSPAGGCRRHQDGERRADDDVPDAPPGRDDRHAAETAEEVEHQHQPEPGVLDADLERDGAPVGLGQAGRLRRQVARQQGEARSAGTRTAPRVRRT